MRRTRKVATAPALRRRPAPSPVPSTTTGALLPRSITHAQRSPRTTARALWVMRKPGRGSVSSSSPCVSALAAVSGAEPRQDLARQDVPVTEGRRCRAVAQQCHLIAREHGRPHLPVLAIARAHELEALRSAIVRREAATPGAE